MCHLSKNVVNESIYNIRQHYFADKKYLNYKSNYAIEKNSENYINLGSNVSQQSMKAVDQMFKSFFALLELVKQGKYESWKVQIPQYLDKDGFYPVVFAHAGHSGIRNGVFTVPMSRFLAKKYKNNKLKIALPEYIIGKHIHQISIIPKHNGKFFEVRYMFDDVESDKFDDLDEHKALSIDLGVDNFATCTTNTCDAFIIDGRKMKSINQWYNKENARLQSIKDYQKIEKCTKRQFLLARKRNRQIDDYIYKSAKYIVTYCIDNKIGNIICGYNNEFQQATNNTKDKTTHQNFTNLPFGRFRDRLEYLCKQVGIRFIRQEESYTSKASFYNKDEMPIWNESHDVETHFSGYRAARGLYKISKGNGSNYVNADVNGSLNIMRKSNVVSLDALYSRGVVLTPTRVRIL